MQGIRRKQRAERGVRRALEYLYILLITNKQNKINETYGSSLSREGFGSVERTAEGTEGTMVGQWWGGRRDTCGFNGGDSEVL